MGESAAVKPDFAAGGAGRGRADFAGFMVGFASLWVQVVLIRRLMASFSGNELTIGIVLAAWMVWTGLGTILPARRSDRVKDPAAALGLCFIAAALLFVPAVLATARIKYWLGVGPGELAGLPVIIASSFIVTGPICFLLGFTFNLAARLQADFRAAAGRAYRFEALGAFVAGVIMAVWFAGRAEPVTPAVVMTVILLTAGMSLPDRKRSRAWALVLAFELTALLIFILAGGREHAGTLDRVYDDLFWGEAELLESFDSRFAYLAAVRRGDEVTIFADGSPAATFPDPATNEVLAHVPLSMCRPPLTVLVIGGGFTGMAGEVAKHPLERMDWVQIDPGWIALEREQVPGFGRFSSLWRVNVIQSDGRAFIRAAGRSYDAIIVNLPDPFTASLNRFYTAEFFEEAKRVLAPGGVVAITAGVTPANLSYSEGQLGLLAGAARTMRSVMENALILPLERNLIVAGGGETMLTADVHRINGVLESRGINSFYASEAVLWPELSPGLLQEVRERVAGSDARADHDLHPRGYLYGIMLWAEKASPRTERAIKAVKSAAERAHPAAWPAGFFALVLAGGLLWSQKSGRAGAAATAAGVSGFAAIVVEFSAMIAFQMLMGSVYFAMTLLTAAFMAGLSGGALLWEKMRESAGLVLAAAALALWCGISLFGVWIMAALEVRGAAGMTGFCAVLFGQGVVAGLLFGAASAEVIRAAGQVGRGVGRINGAEHLGSAAGGILAGVALVPLFGVAGSLACALCAAAGALLVSLRRGKTSYGRS